MWKWPSLKKLNPIKQLQYRYQNNRIKTALLVNSFTNIPSLSSRVLGNPSPQYRPNLPNVAQSKLKITLKKLIKVKKKTPPKKKPLKTKQQNSSYVIDLKVFSYGTFLLYTV